MDPSSVMDTLYLHDIALDCGDAYPPQDARQLNDGGRS